MESVGNGSRQRGGGSPCSNLVHPTSNYLLRLNRELAKHKSVFRRSASTIGIHVLHFIRINIRAGMDCGRAIYGRFTHCLSFRFARRPSILHGLCKRQPDCVAFSRSRQFNHHRYCHLHKYLRWILRRAGRRWIKVCSCQ